MAKNKREVWDELVKRGRHILDKLDDALTPRPSQPRKLARVPIPVRSNPPQLPRNPYEQD